MMQLLSSLALVALIAQTPAAPFEVDLWPGEGRPVFQAVASELVIRETPHLSAKIIRRLKVQKGQHITFDETRYRTTEAGRVAVLGAATIAGRVLGNLRRLTTHEYYTGRFPTEAVAVQKGDEILYLQDRAEGTCFVQNADRVFDADPCPVENDSVFRVITQPKIEWWIRLVRDRVPVGWVLVDDKALKEVRRLF